eukprot:g7306.t1
MTNRTQMNIPTDEVDNTNEEGGTPQDVDNEEEKTSDTGGTTRTRRARKRGRRKPRPGVEVHNLWCGEDAFHDGRVPFILCTHSPSGEHMSRLNNNETSIVIRNSIKTVREEVNRNRDDDDRVALSIFVLRSAMKTLVTDELDRTSRLCLLSNRQQQVAVRHASSNVFVDACDLSTSMSSNVIKKVATGDIVGKSTFKYGILKFAKRFDATITSALSTATTDVVIDDESKEASSFEDTETKMEVVVQHDEQSENSEDTKTVENDDLSSSQRITSTTIPPSVMVQLVGGSKLNLGDAFISIVNAGSAGTARRTNDMSESSDEESDESEIEEDNGSEGTNDMSESSDEESDESEIEEDNGSEGTSGEEEEEGKEEEEQSFDNKPTACVSFYFSFLKESLGREVMRDLGVCDVFGKFKEPTSSDWKLGGLDKYNHGSSHIITMDGARVVANLNRKVRCSAMYPPESPPTTELRCTPCQDRDRTSAAATTRHLIQHVKLEDLTQHNVIVAAIDPGLENIAMPTVLLDPTRYDDPSSWDSKALCEKWNDKMNERLSKGEDGVSERGIISKRHGFRLKSFRRACGSNSRAARLARAKAMSSLGQDACSDEQERAEFSTRDSDVENVRGNLTNVLNTLPSLFKFYNASQRRSRRFIEYNRQRKLMDIAANTLIDAVRELYAEHNNLGDGIGEREVVIAFGDGTFGSSRNHQGGPGHTAFKHALRRVQQKKTISRTDNGDEDPVVTWTNTRVFKVPEPYTTKRCPKCKVDFHPRGRSDSSGMIYMIRGTENSKRIGRHGPVSYAVRDTSICRKCKTMWNRDVAAAINIGIQCCEFILSHKDERAPYLRGRV